MTKPRATVRRKGAAGHESRSGAAAVKTALRPAKNAVRETRSAPIRYRGLSVPYELTAWWRPDGEAIIEPEASFDRDETYKRLRDHADDLNSGAAIRSLREKLGLTQKEAGELLGGGPNAFQKYEKGEVELSQAMLGLLRLLANDPRRLEELKLTADRLPAAIDFQKIKRRNSVYTLLKRPGFGELDLVVVKAEGLRTHVSLVPLKRKRARDWSVVVQRMGVRKNGKVVYRKGPLDERPVDELVDDALREHGLDPRRATWADIIAAVDG